jgi:hypothetical protein
MMLGGNVLTVPSPVPPGHLHISQGRHVHSFVIPAKAGNHEHSPSRIGQKPVFMDAGLKPA